LSVIFTLQKKFFALRLTSQIKSYDYFFVFKIYSVNGSINVFNIDSYWSFPVSALIFASKSQHGFWLFGLTSNWFRFKIKTTTDWSISIGSPRYYRFVAAISRNWGSEKLNLSCFWYFCFKTVSFLMTSLAFRVELRIESIFS